jgi:hypothetical protein
VCVRRPFDSRWWLIYAKCHPAASPARKLKFDPLARSRHTAALSLVLNAHAYYIPACDSRFNGKLNIKVGAPVLMMVLWMGALQRGCRPACLIVGVDHETDAET